MLSRYIFPFAEAQILRSSLLLALAASSICLTQSSVSSCTLSSNAAFSSSDMLCAFSCLSKIFMQSRRMFL